MTNIAVSERKHWLGASESAALFDLSPYTTRFELWHQKVGNIPSPDLSTDERVNAGQFMEPSIAAWAAHKWNWPILNIKPYRQHPSVQRMGCSLDFETVDGLEPVEIKNVDNLIFRDGDWQYEDDTILDAPAHHLIQVQHQLACAPKQPERGWLVVCVGGNKLYRMEVPRHHGFIDNLEREVDTFWATVAANDAPDPNFDIDADAINLLYHGTGIEFADLRNNDRARDLAALYLEGLAIEKGGKAHKAAAMAELKTMMNDARGALIDDGYKISAAHLKECTSVRKPHWRFSVRKAKEPNA
ncbi:MAG: YqaJ viral recombinase family protein [Hyphomicrobium sp.]